MPLWPRDEAVRVLVFFLAFAAVSASAAGAGTDSRVYRCADLQAHIAARGFVFISQPAFGDFVVSGRYYCGGSEIVRLRSVPTADNPQCPVNYCEPTPERFN